MAGGDGLALDQALDECVAGIRAVERASSVYLEDSDLRRLNRMGHIDDPDPHLVTMLEYALSLAKISEGAFDPAVQPLWDLWAAFSARGERPPGSALNQTLGVVDWRGVTMSAGAIHFDRPGMAVTLNSLNQGYAADVVMETLVRHGIAHAFIDTGEFGSRGHHPEGRDWRLGVPLPRDRDKLAFVIDPFKRFVATSGDYETFFSPDFRDHHIFDPRTGYSPPDWSSITVSAPSGLIADGLSTALFVLDTAKAKQLLDTQTNCAARFFDKAGNERAHLA